MPSGVPPATRALRTTSRARRRLRVRDARRSTTKTPPRVPVGIAVPPSAPAAVPRLPSGSRVSHAAQRQPSASLGDRGGRRTMGARALVRSATFARAHQPRDDRRRARPTTPAPRASLPRAALDAPASRLCATRRATRRPPRPPPFPVTPRRRQDRPDVRDRRVPDVLRTAPGLRGRRPARRERPRGGRRRPERVRPVRRLGPGALGFRPRRRRPRRHLRLPRHLLGRRNPPPAFRAGRTLSPPPRPFPPS